ncbi:MAG: DUF4212 domain-containing protein [Pseudomonadales bacterium]|nr:DUF4212 domain-containing protein [Pseudomonadales bacterium]
MSKHNAHNYWRANIRLVVSLLAVWFFISFFCGILIVDTLDQIHFTGFKLGFWVAQQGSIYVFVILILVYIRAMDKLDASYNLEHDREQQAQREQQEQQSNQDNEGVQG